MSSFNTTFGDNTLIHGDAKAVIGTVMLGTQFGTIKIARLTRTGEVIELDDGGGGLRGIIITTPGVELELECAFELEVTAPAPLTQILMPYMGIAGRVMPGAQISWEQGKERGIRIPVSQWDSLIGTTAWRVNPVTGEATNLDEAAAVTATTCDSTQFTCDSTEITSDAT